MHTYLCARHGLGVQDDVIDGAPCVVEGSLQHVPDGCLAGAGGTDNHHTHPLPQLSVQLQCLVDLRAIHHTQITKVLNLSE